MGQPTYLLALIAMVLGEAALLAVPPVPDNGFARYVIKPGTARPYTTTTSVLGLLSVKVRRVGRS